MSKNCKMDFYDFYCLNCGKKSMVLPRRVGFQHGALHRKKLYCPYCKTEVNHIEVKNVEQEKEFLTNFINGVYEDEARESMAALRDSRSW